MYLYIKYFIHIYGERKLMIIICIWRVIVSERHSKVSNDVKSS